MLLTEEETKTKWCPFARNFDERTSATYNQYHNFQGELSLCKCIASKCMAWRWRYPEETGRDDPDGITPEQAKLDPKYVLPNSPRRFKVRVGWCGMAGTTIED